MSGFPGASWTRARRWFMSHYWCVEAVRESGGGAMNGAERRVVVTGMGMVTPVGLDVESSWESLREGRAGVGPITLFDAGGFATRIAAELKGFGLAKDLGADASRWQDHGRNTQ